MKQRQVLWVGGKHTAAIDPDGWLRKTVRSSHMLQKPPAWCFDAEHVAAGEAAQVHGVEVYNADDGKTYRCPWLTFVTSSFRFDRGHGPQVGLALRFWTVSGPEAATVQDRQQEPQDTQPAQLALW